MLQLQRQYGNRCAQRVLAQARKSEHAGGRLVQLKPDTKIDIKTIEWEKGVKEAEKAAKKSKEKAKAYYKELIVRAANKVTAPSPLVDKKPTTGEILWSWSKSGKWSATTDPKKVDNHPGNYWKWLTFNPGAVRKEEAWTVSAILHELDHAAHAKALYDEWIRVGKKGKWDDFWLAHFGKWTEEPIKAGEHAGLVGTLAGLPSKIRPSAIEFRAYVNQFVNFYHKYSLDSQSLIAKAVILFYPLKKQSVEAKISDPALDLDAARKQLLDYFKSPPVKAKDQQKILKTLMAAELRSALVLFRASGDHAQIEKDFRDIFASKVGLEERKEARRKYKPQE